MTLDSLQDSDGDPEKHGPILAHYVNLAQVLGQMLSPILETVVHDLRQPESSIIAIYNGSLTGRKVGDPATNLGKRLLKGDFPDVVVGYENESPNGQKMKSSSLAIRDEEGELIGVMGLNLDISYFDRFSKFISHIIRSDAGNYPPEPERFTGAGRGSTPKDEIKDAIDSFIVSNNWNTKSLSYGDKRKIVEHLYQEGYFNMKGAVTIIADELGLTRPSIYNYKNDYIQRVNGGADDS